MKNRNRGTGESERSLLSFPSPPPLSPAPSPQPTLPTASHVSTALRCLSQSPLLTHCAGRFLSLCPSLSLCLFLFRTWDLFSSLSPPLSLPSAFLSF